MEERASIKHQMTTAALFHVLGAELPDPKEGDETWSELIKKPIVVCTFCHVQQCIIKPFTISEFPHRFAEEKAENDVEICPGHRLITIYPISSAQ
jgi:hypothetical protein